MPIIQSNETTNQHAYNETTVENDLSESGYEAMRSEHAFFFHPQRHLSLFWKSQFLTPSSLMMVAYLRFRLDPVLKYRPEHVMYKHKIV